MKTERENCGFEELMVAYIYDEATSAERRRFEGHMLDCSPCTEEFAALSNARLSVFEWQKEDFAGLSTPKFEMPYKRTENEPKEIGWLGKIEGIFAGFGTPIAAAASILIILGLGFTAFTLLKTSEQQIAANIGVKAPVVEQKPVVSQVVVPDPVSPITRAEDREPAKERELVPVRANEVRRVKTARPTVTQTAERRVNTTRNRKAPSLSDFEENDDKSLRLTDLFDGEIGGVY